MDLSMALSKSSLCLFSRVCICLFVAASALLCVLGEFIWEAASVLYTRSVGLC